MRFVAFLWLVGALSVQAQAPDGMQVLEFTAGGELLLLPITAASAGNEPMGVTDATTEIHWVNGIGVTTKLTVETVCPGQRFGLTVDLQVTSFGAGTVATVQPAVLLIDGMMPTDVLRDMGAVDPDREGTGILTYSASATVANGTSADHGDDYHTITYTLIEQ